MSETYPLQKKPQDRKHTRSHKRLVGVQRQGLSLKSNHRLEVVVKDGPRVKSDLGRENLIGNLSRFQPDGIVLCDTVKSDLDGTLVLASNLRLGLLPKNDYLGRLNFGEVLFGRFGDGRVNSTAESTV